MTPPTHQWTLKSGKVLAVSTESSSLLIRQKDSLGNHYWGPCDESYLSLRSAVAEMAAEICRLAVKESS